MKFLLTSWNGQRWELPAVLAWRLSYGAGTPCDSFEVRCAWGEQPDSRLRDATRFTAEQDGAVVFCGVVDECECSWDRGGSALMVTGRSMAALLLDNEAMPADYCVATLSDILRDHVTPYGIQVAQRGNGAPAEGFSVESGSSEWQVLRSFVRRHGGAEPRFDRTGGLVLVPWSGRRLAVDEDTPVTALTWREKRYGVYSEVLVRDRVEKRLRRAVNQDFLSRGGRSRRVVTMPGKTAGGDMLDMGERLLEESGRAQSGLELRLGGLFAAWPGDVLEFKRKKPRADGAWRVVEMETGAGESGDYTALTLERA